MTNKMLFFLASTIYSASLVDAMVPNGFYYQPTQRAQIDQMGTLNVPTHVNEILDREFAGNQRLHNINIPGNIKRIGAFSFCLCRNVTSINLSNGVCEISDYAFAGLDQVRDLIIPPSVRRIGQNALYKLNLRSFYILNPYCIIEPQDQFTAEQSNLPDATDPNIPHQNMPVMQMPMQHNTIQARQPTVQMLHNTNTMQMQNPATQKHDVSFAEMQQYDSDDSLQSSISDVQTQQHHLQLTRNSVNTFKPIPINVDGMTGSFDGRTFILEGKCIQLKKGCKSFISKLLINAIYQKEFPQNNMTEKQIYNSVKNLNNRLTTLNCQVELNDDGTLFLKKKETYTPSYNKITNNRNVIFNAVPEFQFNHKYKIGKHELMINDQLQLCINSDININLLGRRSPYKRLIILAKMICSYPTWIQFPNRIHANKHKQTFTDQYFNGTNIFIENYMNCIRLNSRN